MARKKSFNLTSLATSDQKDIKRLSTYAAKGWHLSKVKVPYFSYELQEYEGAKRTYLIDYQEKNDDHYINTYKLKGWSYVCSYKNLHYFKGTLNTPQIYTDVKGKIALYQHITKQLFVGFLLLAITNVLTFVAFNYFNTQPERIMSVVSLLFAVGLLLIVVNAILAYASFSYYKRTQNLRKDTKHVIGS